MVIIPDHDEAGHKYADVAVRQLIHRARSLKRLKLASLDGSENRKDITDWFDLGLSLSMLWEVVHGADVITDAPPRTEDEEEVWGDGAKRRAALRKTRREYKDPKTASERLTLRGQEKNQQDTENPPSVFYTGGFLSIRMENTAQFLRPQERERLVGIVIGTQEQDFWTKELKEIPKYTAAKFCGFHQELACPSHGSQQTLPKTITYKSPWCPWCPTDTAEQVGLLHLPDLPGAQHYRSVWITSEIPMPVRKEPGEGASEAQEDRGDAEGGLRELDRRREAGQPAEIHARQGRHPLPGGLIFLAAPSHAGPLEAAPT